MPGFVYRIAKHIYRGHPLLKRKPGRPDFFKRIFFIILSLVFLSNIPAKATHLIGGSITYTYLGTTRGTNLFRYLVKVDMFRDCSTYHLPQGQQFPTPFDQTIDVGVYERVGDTTLYTTLSIDLGSDLSVNPPNNGCCGPTGNSYLDSVCINEGIYTAEVDLPSSIYGYYLLYARCCRNTMVNVPIDIGETYFAIIPPTSIPNNTPQFTAVPAPYICVHDTISVSYATVDPDGDSLVYSLEQPYAGGSANNAIPAVPSTFSTGADLPGVPYNTSYSPQFPMGNKGGYASINKQTGILSVYATLQGRYAIAVDVYEYRKGKYISKTRRDVQLIVISGCGLNDAPKRIPITNDTITVDKTLTSIFRTEAGTELLFGIRFVADNSKPSPCPVNIATVKAAGFINTGGFTSPPTLSTVVYDTLDHSATVYFTWQTSCVDANSNPYNFTLTVTDDACPPKTTTQGFEIYVYPFSGANKILGPSPVCQTSPSYLYSSNYQKKGYHLTWDVSGGAYSNGPNDSTISVVWGNNPSGTVKVVGWNTTTGCPGDSVFKNIVINPKPSPPVISGPPFACKGKISSYTAQSLVKSSYTWSVSGGSLTNSGSQAQTANVTWTKADTNNIWVLGTDSAGCGSDSGVAKVVVEQPIADSIYGSNSVCPNSFGIDYWVNPQNGSTYYWKITGGTQLSGGNGANIKVNWGNEGTGTVKVVEITTHGCPGDTIGLTVAKEYKLKTSPIRGDTSVCENTNNVPYSVTFSNGSYYNWQITGGSIASGQGTGTILVNWDGVGKGVIMVTETAYDPVNHDSCIGVPEAIFVNIYGVPTTSVINGPTGLCEGDTGIYSVAGLPGSTFLWEFNGRKSNYLTDSAQFSETGLANETDTVNIEVTEYTKNGCPGPVRSLTVTIHKLPVTSAITGPDVICSPNLNGVVYQVTGFATSTYNWTITGGTITSGDKTNKITVNWDSSGNQSVKVQEISSFGCAGPPNLAKSLKVKVDSLALDMQLVTTDVNNDKEIDIYWSAKNTTFFSGYYLIYRSTEGQEFFRLIDSVPSTRTYYTDTKVSTSAYAYRYKVVAVNSCGNQISTPVHRTIKLTGTFDLDTTITLNWNPYEGWPVDVYNINTAPDRDLSLSIYNFTKDTQFAVIKTLNGYQLALRISALEDGVKNVVSWSNQVLVDFNPIVWIPNVFTPQNGDDLNNTFHVFVANYKTYQIDIYNRWGEHVFRSEDPNVQWDGTFKGSICDEGVYLYQVVVHGAKTDIFRNGTLNLMR